MDNLEQKRRIVELMKYIDFHRLLYGMPTKYKGKKFKSSDDLILKLKKEIAIIHGARVELADIKGEGKK